MISTAIYCRLSQDDGSVGESGSIQTQRTLLTQYCSEHDFPIHDYYCDDGWSGTNFERPEFKRMMSDIEGGKINLVIVKDLSRFGREYAQMGIYIEHYFEEKSVRFISVAENIDTAKGTDGLVLPFTNVINSFYARQVSAKTKAAFAARAKDGMFIGSRAPYGYIKDPQDKHHLIVDPEAAKVVRDIFRMFAQGIGYGKITKILRERGVLNPQAYFNENNPGYYKDSDYWRRDFDWHATSVRTILNNPVYLGKTVFGKTKTKGNFDKTRLHTSEDEQIIVEGTHEAIIAQDEWDVVHQMMQTKRRENLSGEVQYFAGLVRCADCGSALNVSYDYNRKRYNGFSCWVYKNYGKNRCTSHAIGWVTLNTLVLNDIRRNAAMAAHFEKLYADMLRRAKSESAQNESARLRRELTKAEKRITDLSKILNKLYEDYALERITAERHKSMSEVYSSELSELTERCKQISSELSKSDEIEENISSFLPIIRKYTDLHELNARILNELIEKIVVHEKEKAEDGTVTQQVDIYYKFIGLTISEKADINMLG
ncbi:MAG: recombinase family protein [Oscillospiraceae bacterium]|nr:recombinase family protein [Oscillospiraceae bacterium]